MAPPRAVVPWWRRYALPAALIAVFLLTGASRAAVMGETLVNWDAVQYAMGLTHFDVVRHQPHPPGSILYEALGAAALTVAGEANRALAWVSVAAGAASVVVCYLAAREMFGARLAWAAMVLYAASPLTWFYGAVALPYSAEAALSLGVVLLCWRAMEERDRRAALWAAAVLAVAGGVRQTTLALLLPLWVYSAWLSGPHPRPRPGAERGVTTAARGGLTPPLVLHGASPLPTGEGPGVGLLRRAATLLTGLVILAAVCAVWAIPTVWLSRGLASYLAASRELSSLVSSMSAVTAVGLAGPAENVQYVWEVAGFGLNLALVCFVVYALPLRPPVRWPWQPTRAQFWFLALWAAPALATYVVLHVGQAGYLLLVWPLACVLAAQAALSAAGAFANYVGLAPRIAGPLVLALCAAASAALFLVPPALSPPAGLSAAAIRSQDDEWREIKRLAAGQGPASTTIVTGTRSAESFRLASYYLPQFFTVAVGPDREGTLGVAFRAYGGDHDYARFMLGGAAALVQPLPTGTTRLLIMDDSAAALIPTGQLETVPVSRWRSVWLYPAEAGGTIEVLTFPRPLVVERR